jgi:hypothetical protein
LPVLFVPEQQPKTVHSSQEALLLSLLDAGAGKNISHIPGYFQSLFAIIWQLMIQAVWICFLRQVPMAAWRQCCLKM